MYKYTGINFLKLCSWYLYFNDTVHVIFYTDIEIQANVMVTFLFSHYIYTFPILRSLI